MLYSKPIRMLKRNWFLVLTGCVVLLLAACGGGDSSPANGQLTVRITDAPVDMADNVFVQFSALELHGPDGSETIPFDPPIQIDLMTLTEGNTADFINNLQLPAGRYQWLRLTVDTADDLDTYIVVGDTSHELTIPSGAQNGLKLVSGFDVPEGNSAIYVIDFDLRKSVTQDNNGYKLRPTLRLLDEARVGLISGSVDLATYGCTEEGAAVYVYEGFQQLPNDVTEGGPNPITSAKVKFDDIADEYRYTAAFVHNGEYTVALTCMADDDDPVLDDEIDFFDPQDATVTKGSTTTVDFPEIQ